MAPEFDTPIPMGVSTAPISSGAPAEATSESDAGAATSTGLGAAGSAGAQVQSAAPVRARRCLQRLWASSKASGLPFRARVRGSKTALPYNNLILWVVRVSLLRVGDLAYTYSEWHKTVDLRLRTSTQLPAFAW